MLSSSADNSLGQWFLAECSPSLAACDPKELILLIGHHPRWVIILAQYGSTSHMFFCTQTHTERKGGCGGDKIDPWWKTSSLLSNWLTEICQWSFFFYPKVGKQGCRNTINICNFQAKGTPTGETRWTPARTSNALKDWLKQVNVPTDQHVCGNDLWNGPNHSEQRDSPNIARLQTSPSRVQAKNCWFHAVWVVSNLSNLPARLIDIKRLEKLSFPMQFFKL